MLSKVTKNDADRFAEYKAKRLAQKDANKARLAAEFPLLFGQDEKSRSTIGKYTNKAYPTTPSKKKVAKKTAIVDENTGFSKSAPLTSALSQPRIALSPKKMSLPGGSSNGNTKKKSLSINFGAFSSSTNVIEPLEMEMKDVTKKETVEDPTPLEAPVTFETEARADDTFSDQLNDVLGYLLENNEVDLSKHKRLSTHSFSKETIRRLSIRSSAEIKLEMKRASILSEVTDEVVMESDPLVRSDAAVNSEENGEVEQILLPDIEIEDDAPLEVDDLDVLNALRIYIAQLDDEVEAEPVTVDGDAVAIEAPTELKNKADLEPVSHQEDAAIEEISAIIAKEDVTAVVVADELQTTAITSLEIETTVIAPVQIATMPKPQEKTVLFPRMTFFQEVMRKGLVRAEVTNWVPRDGHIKYVIFISVSILFVVR